MNKQEFAKVFLAWADREKIQWTRSSEPAEWRDFIESDIPSWRSVEFCGTKYRIKPKDVIEHRYTYSSWAGPAQRDSDVKLTYTNGKLTNAEVLK